jgi:hypothetical protein
MREQWKNCNMITVGFCWLQIGEECGKETEEYRLHGVEALKSLKPQHEKELESHASILSEEAQHWKSFLHLKS